MKRATTCHICGQLISCQGKEQPKLEHKLCIEARKFGAWTKPEKETAK